MDSLPPILPNIQTSSSGEPQLMGLRCGGCEAVFLDIRSHCAACGARDGLASSPLGPAGVLHAFTVVYRSFPGVPVPYVSAVVDLEGGGTVKGNLVEVPADPAAISVGMPVDLVFREAPVRDEEGRGYLAWCFVPRGVSS